MTRVLNVTHYPVFGGPHNEVLRLAAPLREAGVEMTVLLPDEPGNAAERLRSAGIDVLTMPLHRLRATTRPLTHLRLVARFWPEVQAIRSVVRERDIDIVKINGLVNPHGAIAARLEGVPVVWVQHSDEDLPFESSEWQWVPELQPGPDEPLVHKKFNSSFEETDLDNVLARLGATHVVLAGAATNWCIRATAYGALDRGYDLTLIKDAHTTDSLEFEDGTVIAAEHIITELNVGLRWVSYPGRSSSTATAEQVDFTLAKGTGV